MSCKIWGGRVALDPTSFADAPGGGGAGALEMAVLILAPVLTCCGALGYSQPLRTSISFDWRGPWLIHGSGIERDDSETLGRDSGMS